MPIPNDRSSLPEIVLRQECNYIAVFLTMACPYRCSYCINEHESPRKKEDILPGSEWVRGLSRLTNLERQEGAVPVTLQGGEPSVHPDFYEIINGLPERIPIDLLTNLSFDVERFIARVDPARLKRQAPYASIRVSYHPGQVAFEELLVKTHRLMEAGFSIGIYGVLHPDQQEHILAMQQRAVREGVDFRTKEFLGFARGRLYGQYKYEDACTLSHTRQVRCRTSELLIGAGGNVYRCHHDLYEQGEPIGHILDPGFEMMNEPRPCRWYGHCNPCDIKVKTNRLQQFGYTAVDIEFPATAGGRRKSRRAVAAATG
ncbi:MAG: Cyclic pyranopterin monophosphate synthase [Planctomycetes bacterium ADurb.Bin412]|nr:MAG: Cyclic pyranopterin monophosphate synthase [Planctomycetes bacterium ADurb.Bin412]